jgi:hypothetical protein
MATICVVTLEEHQAAIDELRAEFRDLLGAYVTENEQWVSTKRGAELACISRSTLVISARASAPGKEEVGRITYHKQGTKSLYSRSSCIDYMRRKKGLPALRN